MQALVLPKETQQPPTVISFLGRDFSRSRLILLQPDSNHTNREDVQLFLSICHSVGTSSNDQNCRSEICRPAELRAFSGSLERSAGPLPDPSPRKVGKALERPTRNLNALAEHSGMMNYSIKHPLTLIWNHLTHILPTHPP
jgi:hypothetical protein